MVAKSGNYIPDRGDIVWLNFDPHAGHEQCRKRPALVLTPKIYNQKTSLCIALPITSKIKGYPFEIKLPSDLKIEGVILSDQVKNLDFKIREATFICKAPNYILKEAQQNAKDLISG